ADVHRAGGDAAVGDEGIVDAQDLVDDGVEPCVVDAGPQARLQGGKGGQVVHQDADALRDRAQVAAGPVAQDRDELGIDQRPTVYGAAHEAGGEVVGVAGGPARRVAPRLEHGQDDRVEGLGDASGPVAVARAGG